MKEAMGILDGVCHAMGVMDGIFGESKDVLDVISVSPKLSETCSLLIVLD